jgi:phage terminase large subunit
MSALRAPDLEPWQHAWLNSHKDPYLFATGCLGFLPADAPNPGNQAQLEHWQEDYLKNFFIGPDGKPTDSPRISVRAGHGVGKGMILAILAVWFPLTHYDAKAVITANSQDQLRDNNWPEIMKMANRLPNPLAGQLQIDGERMFIKAQPEMAFVVRRTASRHNPEALQGIHAKHVLYLIDEASGIAEIVFEVAQGSLSTHGAMAVMMSNPTKASGFFHMTHTKLRDRWRTMRVNCEDVPRARGHIEDVIKTYGKDSNKYRVRVLGEFPTKDDDTVIPLELLEAAKGRNVKVADIWPVWGLDVSRFGDDRTCLVKRQGNAVLEAPIIWRNLSTTQIAGRVIDEYRRTLNELKPKEIRIDVIGWGAGVVDVLNESGSPVKGITLGINVAESPAIKEQYHRLRDELWFLGREWFSKMDCSLPQGCEELIAELSTPTYDFTGTGKNIVMSKDEMKKELGYSPDIADAFLLTMGAGVYPREPERHRRYSSGSSRRDPWGA